ncbi:MAG: hypothetical protein KIH69_006930 [Anaerolineae bacterium]|nr:hypothetical protein [Anaerolineae bacterium]
MQNLIQTRMTLVKIDFDNVQLFTHLPAKLGNRDISVPYMVKAAADAKLLSEITRKVNVGEEIAVSLTDTKDSRTARLTRLTLISFTK